MSLSSSVLMAESEIAMVADVLTNPPGEMPVARNFNVADIQAMTDRIL